MRTTLDHRHQTAGPGRRLHHLLAAAALPLLAACSNGSEGPPTADAEAEAVSAAGIAPVLLAGYAPPLEEERQRQAAVAGLSSGLALHAQMAKAVDPNDNLVLSPLSIAAAFAMLMPGATSPAADEIATALALEAIDHPVEAVAGLLHLLRQRDDEDNVTLRIANRSFVQDAWAVDPAYVQTLASWFGDAMATVDYRADHEAARAKVNDWVAQKTADRIPELMPEGSIDPLTRLVLVNALYLLADWKHPFEAEQTSETTFNRADGSSVEVDMMRDRRALPIYLGDDVAAFELAYAGDALALTVIVPDDWNRFAAELDSERLQRLLDGLQDAEADIGLPKLETRTASSLVAALQALGVKRIFRPEGALAGIADDWDLHVAAVQHETYLRMDETGTEAAAATGIGVGITSVPPSVPIIVADRPYFILLRDRITGAVIFMGRIVDPTAG